MKGGRTTQICDRNQAICCVVAFSTFDYNDGQGQVTLANRLAVPGLDCVLNVVSA
jgi:hypothetical protein